MTVAAKKFLFNTDFRAGTQPEADAVSKAALEAAIADAEARGRQAGYAAGQTDAHAEAQRRIALALDRIGMTLDGMAGGLAGIEKRLEGEAIEVAVAVASKLAAELIAREPFAEIAALAADCFNQLVAAPHVVVRLNDALYADARERLEDIARMRGFEGRLVVLAEPDIAPGDCRIEWADGGVTRERAKTEAAIGEAVAGYIAVSRDRHV
jgi:flagellar assembly protein FliH